MDQVFGQKFYCLISDVPAPSASLQKSRHWALVCPRLHIQQRIQRSSAPPLCFSGTVPMVLSPSFSFLPKAAIRPAVCWFSGREERTRACGRQPQLRRRQRQQQPIRSSCLAKLHSAHCSLPVQTQSVQCVQCDCQCAVSPRRLLSIPFTECVPFGSHTLRITHTLSQPASQPVSV